VYSLCESVTGNAPDELVLRLPAAVAGFLTLPACYWAFRPALGRRAAAALVLVLAVSSWELTWSQTARFYTTVQLLGVVATGLWLRALAQVRVPQLLSGLALVALAAAFHPTAALLLAGFLAGPWAARLFGAGAVPRALALCLLLALGLVLLGTSGWGLMVLETWRSRHAGANPRHFVLSTGYLATPTVGLGLVVGTFLAFRRRVASQAPVVGCALVSLGAASTAALLVRVSAQYVFVLYPLMVAVACLPLAAPGLAARPLRSAAYVLLLLLPGALDSVLYLTVRHGDRPDWRGAYAHVYENLEPGDLVLGMEAPVAEYYLDPRRPDLRAWENVVWLDDWRDDLAAVWRRYPRRTWFVVNDEQMEDWSRSARDDMRAHLREECRLVWEDRVPLTPRDLSLQVYLRP